MYKTIQFGKNSVLKEVVDPPNNWIYRKHDVHRDIMCKKVAGSALGPNPPEPVQCKQGQLRMYRVDLQYRIQGNEQEYLFIAG